MSGDGPTLVEMLVSILLDVARTFAGIFGLSLTGAAIGIGGLLGLVFVTTLTLNMSGKSGWSLRDDELLAHNTEEALSSVVGAETWPAGGPLVRAPEGPLASSSEREGPES